MQAPLFQPVSAELLAIGSDILITSKAQIPTCSSSLDKGQLIEAWGKETRLSDGKSTGASLQVPAEVTSAQWSSFQQCEPV